MINITILYDLIIYILIFGFCSVMIYLEHKKEKQREEYLTRQLIEEFKITVNPAIKEAIYKTKEACNLQGQIKAL